MSEVSAAIVTIKRAGDMTPEGRKLIADWLRERADLLEKDGEQYAPLFRARYTYPDRSKNG